MIKPLKELMQRKDLTEFTEALASGADINARDEHGETPLIWAIRQNYEAAGLMLIEAGADTQAPTAAGSAPLALARVYRRAVLAERLDAVRIKRENEENQEIRHEIARRRQALLKKTKRPLRPAKVMP